MNFLKIFIPLFYLMFSIAYADTQNHVQIKLIPSVDTAIAGQSFDLILEQKIDEHWHTYWKNPGESGLPIQVKWNAPEGVEISAFQWPVPKALDVQGIMNFIYEDTVHLIATVKIPENLQDKTLSITAHADWLVCEEICIPETGVFSVDLPVGEHAQLVNQGIFKSADRALPSLYTGLLSLRENGTHFELELEINPFKAGDPILFFSEDWGLVKAGSAADIQTKNSKTIFSFPRTDRALADISSFKGVLAQGNIGFQINEIPLTVSEEKLSPPPVQTNLWSAVLFAILGGLILNLMPCVFPILSMKALSLVKISDKSRGDSLKHGLSYTAGVLLSFAGLAGLIIALKAGGAEIGWGFQLQNPLVVLILTWVLFAIGLNLFGSFDVTTRWTHIGSGTVAKSTGLVQDFLTGILAVIVATPCTAPFMGVALGYALLQPPSVTFLIFLSLGFGLSLPFLLFSFLPVLQKIMPKPGAWMEIFKQFLAFPMWATTIWLTWVLVQQAGTNGLIAVLSGALLISLSAWLLTHKPLGIWRWIKILLLILCVVGIFKATQFQTTQAYEQIAYTPETLKRELSTDHPVFVNMTAAWCITCKINEVIFKREDIQTAFNAQNTTYIVGDWTLLRPEITAYLESFDRTGVPLYIYYPARNKETGDRPDPQILPQILTPSMLKNILVPNN